MTDKRRYGMPNRRKAVTDLTVGDPLKVIIAFSVPLFLSSILQQVYNLTDISIIGHVLGDDALSSIGAVSTIYNLFNSLMFGMGNGISLVVARFFGADDEKGLRKAVANTMLLAAVWGSVITVVALLTLKPLMKLLNTPEEIFMTSYGYVSILLSLIVLPFIYNVLSGLLRALGNSRAPLYFLIISVVTNIFLDILFVWKFGWGLEGAAYATAIAQALSSLMCFIYIKKFVPELHITRDDHVISKSILSDLFSAGFSFAMMFTVVNVGTVVLQGAINSFGVTTIGAHTAARKVSELCMMLVGTFSGSMATFAGQNHGAGKYYRIKEGLKKIILASFVLDTLVILMIYTVGRYIVILISGSSNEELISTAMFYLHVDLPFYYVLSILLITRNTMQGMGAKWTPIIASLVELSLKAFTAGWLAKKLGYTGIAICEPLIWFVCAIYILIAFKLSLKKQNDRFGKDAVPYEERDELFDYEG